MRQRLLELVYAGVLIAFLWLGFRYLLPWTAPIIVAFAAASLLEAAVRPLIRRGFHRKYASAIMTLAVLSLLGYAVFRLISGAAELAAGFAGEVPELMASLLETTRTLRGEIEKYTASAPESLRQYLKAAADSAERTAFALPAQLSQRAMSAVGSMVQALPDLLLFAVTAGIGTYFISASYPEITEFIVRQLPETGRNRIYELKADIKNSFGGFLRAQLILMLITFFELLAAFLLLGVSSAPAAAAVTALVDALPVFGVGTVLLPWSIYMLLTGRRSFALWLVLLWLGVNLVRNCIQAKLLGDQIGLDPVVTLLGVYTGWKVCGVLGMLSFPLIFVTVVQLNEKGVIRLWKRK